MNSEIIKYVAGAGKTTDSMRFLSEHQNGLYLAFTNSVVDEVCSKGYLAKTIDSLFFSYIIPKFTSVIPFIASGSKVQYLEKEGTPKTFLGIRNIHIDAQSGSILNKDKPTGLSLTNSREILSLNNKPNLHFLRILFSEQTLYLTDTLRNELSHYIILHFSAQLMSMIDERFSYVIIDEAQDLNGYKESFAKMLDESNIKVLILGDNNQNIMGGGGWFELKKPTKVNNESKRSPEPICAWIRDNLGIEIYGNDELFGKYFQIEFDNVTDYDDGSRCLLYNSRTKKYAGIIDSWSGPKATIKSAKGSTIEADIVVIGNVLNKKNFYTALTRTKGNAYSTVSCNQ